MPPKLSDLWRSRSTISQFFKIGTKKRVNGSVFDHIIEPPKLSQLPLLNTWQLDGGCFVTLPLVHTQHPVTKIPNLGMYRLQRFNDQTTGFHCQIGKGAGFHLTACKETGTKLPVNVYIGGAPALILAAVAPLPENVPELYFSTA